MPTKSPEKIVMYLQTQSFAENCKSLYEQTLIGKNYKTTSTIMIVPSSYLTESGSIKGR